MITQLFIYNEFTISNKLNSTRFLKANEILSIEKFFDSSKYYFLFKKKKKNEKEIIRWDNFSILILKL